MNWPWKRRKRPSYEIGKLRDSLVEELQDPEYRSEDLKDAIRKVAKGKTKDS